MLSTTKVYVDSRYAVQNSGASVEYQIPGGLDLKPSTRCWLSEFTCVAAWDTIDSTNNILYLLEGTTHRAVQIPHGVYDLESLRVAFQSALNSASKTASMGTYSVELRASGSAGGTFRVYEVSCTTGTFGLPSDANVNTAIGPPISSTNSIVSFPSGGAQLTSHTSGFVDLRRVHSLYIHSPSFAAYNSLGPRGVRSIVAKIPVSVGYGGLVTWLGTGSEHDYIEVGVSALTSLKLELRDAAGELLNLNNTHWSCTLLFER
jgi:hypothetical protein